MLKLYTIGFYYLEDYSEKCYYYLVYAYSEKQAKFFLSKHLGTAFTSSLKQGYALRYKTNNNIAVLVCFNYSDVKENDYKLAGKIQTI